MESAWAKCMCENGRKEKKYLETVKRLKEQYNNETNRLNSLKQEYNKYYNMAREIEIELYKKNVENFESKKNKALSFYERAKSYMSTDYYLRFLCNEINYKERCNQVKRDKESRLKSVNERIEQTEKLEPKTTAKLVFGNLNSKVNKKNSKEIDDDDEKKANEIAEVNRSNWEYYNKYKAKIQELRRQGRTNTEEYREYIRLLKMTESALPIKYEDKYSTKLATEDLANTITSGIEAFTDLIEYEDSFLSVSYGNNFLNEFTIGGAYRGYFGGGLFWEIDVSVWGSYFEGWKLKTSTDDNISSNEFEEGDLYWSNREGFIDDNFLYKKDNILLLGPEVATGFGYSFHLSNESYLNLVGLLSFKGGLTETISTSFGYKFGLEYNYKWIGIGAYYNAYNFNIDFEDEFIISGTEETDFFVENTTNNITYFTPRNRSAKDINKRELEFFLVRLNIYF